MHSILKSVVNRPVDKGVQTRCSSDVSRLAAMSLVIMSQLKVLSGVIRVLMHISLVMKIFLSITRFPFTKWLTNQKLL